MTEALPGWRAYREDGSALSFRVLRTIALKVPFWITDPMIWALSGLFAMRRHRTPTVASRAYLGALLGRPPTWAEMHRHARTFAHVLFDRARFIVNGADSFRLDTHGVDLIDAVRDAGKGAVMLGAHYGSFEALRALGRDQDGLDVRYMMFPENAENSTRLLNELNPEIASKVISLADGPAAMIRAHEALSTGAFIAFLGDRLPNAQSRARIDVDFLGRAIPVPTSPYLTAMAAGVPLLLCFAPRVGSRHYEISFSMLYDGSPVARSERAAKVRELADLYADAVTDRCRRDPYNWFNFYDIWDSEPDLHGSSAGER